MINTVFFFHRSQHLSTSYRATGADLEPFLTSWKLEWLFGGFQKWTWNHKPEECHLILFRWKIFVHIREEPFTPQLHPQVAVNVPLVVCSPAESFSSFPLMTHHHFPILIATQRSSEGAFVWLKLGWHRLACWHAIWHFGAGFTALEEKLEHTQMDSFPSKTPSSYPNTLPPRGINRCRSWLGGILRQ